MKEVKVPNKLVEIKEYDYNGIKVLVKINYIHNKVSLVESQNFENFNSKKWLFAERGVEYMIGWVNILEAMKYAIKEAEKDYLAELARVSAFKEKDLVEFHIKMAELDKPKTSKKK